jgi:hypothetical protein
MSYKIERMKDQMSLRLDQIAALFKAPVKITIVVRDPNDEQCEVVLTDDNYDEVRKAIGRAEIRETQLPASPVSEPESGERGK